MKCKLEEIWENQAEQQRGFNMDPKAMTEIGKANAAKGLLLGLNEEVVKLAQSTTQYKAHVLKSSPVDKTNVADAAVDVMKYTIAIAQLYGITAREFFESFKRKTEVVWDKARGERLELERNTPVVVLDVDNVIADLTDWDKNLKQARGESDDMKDKVVDMLESMKTTFYRDGGFLKLKPISGAVEGISLLKRYGWKIVLVSARPYWQYKRIHADTVQWLRERGIEYDLLLFNKDKAEAIHEFIFPAMPSFLVEDREKHVIETTELGVRVLLMSYPYNETVRETELITRVNTWDEIVKAIGRP